MNYEEALNYIHAVQWAGHKPGLTRTRTLLAALGDERMRWRYLTLTYCAKPFVASTMKQQIGRKV